MAHVLAISSLVAHGHVGLSAMLPALQALGHDVSALPTILLSNHPGHPRAAGDRVAPSLLARMLGALDDNGWLSEVDAVITGYCPSPEHAELAADAIRRVRSRSPRATVLVDAVLGDEPKGLYVAPEAAAAVRDLLVPLADIVKGNAFEVRWLGSAGRTGARPPEAGSDATSPGAVDPLAALLGVPALVATSVGAAGGRLVNVLSTAAGGRAEASVPERVGVPKGTGDLLAALLAGHLLRSNGDEGALHRAFILAVAGVDRVVSRSLGKPELDLVATLRDLGRDRDPGAP